MTKLDRAGDSFYTYAMALFFRAGHVATSEPEFINHSPNQFLYFDNKTDVVLSSGQRALFDTFDNVSRLFSVNRCVFFSINLLTVKETRSQIAHDIHTMIHPAVDAEGTICIFRHLDDVMLSFAGFGLRCILSDWYPIIDDYETLLARVDIANVSIDRNVDYFLDMVYMLGRSYYLSDIPSTYDLLPANFISDLGLDEVDREEINQYVQEQLTNQQREYGYDYVEYDDSVLLRNEDIGADLDLMLLELDDEEDNPFGEEIESEEDSYDDFFDEDDEYQEKDVFEFDDVDPEIFRDPTLLVKWLQKNESDEKE